MIGSAFARFRRGHHHIKPAVRQFFVHHVKMDTFLCRVGQAPPHLGNDLWHLGLSRHRIPPTRMLEKWSSSSKSLRELPFPPPRWTAGSPPRFAARRAAPTFLIAY